LSASAERAHNRAETAHSTLGERGASGHTGFDPTSWLIGQIGRVKLLSAAEERQLGHVIQTCRKEFTEVLFSFMPVARRAVDLISESLVEGCKPHHSRILHISTIDSDAEKTLIEDDARRIVREVRVLLDLCSDRWKTIHTDQGAVADRHEVFKSILRDQQKIDCLLSQVAIRPAFVADFLSHFEKLVATVRSCHQEVENASDAEVRKGKMETLNSHLDSAEETLENVLGKSDRLFLFHEAYLKGTDTLISLNIPLAISWAKKFVNRGLPLEDLIQEAITGVMMAVDRFEEERRVRFSTYATPWIVQSLYRALEQSARTVRIHGRALTAIRKVRAFEQSFRAVHERSPTPEEIADAFKGSKGGVKITADWIMKMFPALGPVSSIHRPLSEATPERGRWGDLPVDQSESPSDAVHKKMLLEQRAYDLESSFTQLLDERERNVISLRFGLSGAPPMTLEEIGNKLGIGKDRVRQIEQAALKALRRSELSKHYSP
jgi:RNA polymerase sigma factor (sigma-70 family)